ncbi:hypothetical protein DFA_03770 [Cavenderia fasciculata]|uniref:PHD zinc finger-containing protein n=1 Tax=Cavenderia fasciculata TaxID=261658 RepID=F4Q0C5_CACFS|nr:uncharacterized protein DFA_03770 [Cavenderia fasciculata]EGG18276.1 hypothetical protein DFA_03770 [Cavenderia fasciculata]|eukprot:XP_004357099.1 hypothetical protein DFA_03770 [Cavenderia fasciculata]
MTGVHASSLGTSTSTTTSSTTQPQQQQQQTIGSQSDLHTNRRIAMKKKEEKQKVTRERQVAKERVKENLQFYIVNENEEQLNSVGLVNNDFCDACHDGGDLLCCESCECAFHMMCLDPPVSSLPEGDWFCHSCEQNKNPKPKHSKSILSSLFDSLDTLNPSCFTLPEEYLLNNSFKQSFCNVCDGDDSMEDMLHCSHSKCRISVHTYCLDPPLVRKPLTWKCDLHADKQQQQKSNNQSNKKEKESVASTSSSVSSMENNQNSFTNDSNKNRRNIHSPFLSDRFTLEFGGDSTIGGATAPKVFQNRYNPSYRDPFYENIYGNGLSSKDYYDHQLIVDLFGKDNYSFLTNNNQQQQQQTDINNNNNNNNQKNNNNNSKVSHRSGKATSRQKNKDGDHDVYMDDEEQQDANNENLKKLDQLLKEQRRLSVASMPSEFGIFPSDLSNQPIDNCNSFVMSSLSPLFTQFLAWQRLMQINNQIFQARANFHSTSNPSSNPSSSFNPPQVQPTTTTTTTTTFVSEPSTPTTNSMMDIDSSSSSSSSKKSNGSRRVEKTKEKEEKEKEKEKEIEIPIPIPTPPIPTPAPKKDSKKERQRERERQESERREKEKERERERKEKEKEERDRRDRERQEKRELEAQKEKEKELQKEIGKEEEEPQQMEIDRSQSQPQPQSQNIAKFFKRKSMDKSTITNLPTLKKTKGAATTTATTLDDQESFSEVSIVIPASPEDTTKHSVTEQWVSSPLPTIAPISTPDKPISTDHRQIYGRLPLRIQHKNSPSSSPSATTTTTTPSEIVSPIQKSGQLSPPTTPMSPSLDSSTILVSTPSASSSTPNTSIQQPESPFVPKTILSPRLPRLPRVPTIVGQQQQPPAVETLSSSSSSTISPSPYKPSTLQIPQPPPSKKPTKSKTVPLPPAVFPSPSTPSPPSPSPVIIPTAVVSSTTTATTTTGILSSPSSTTPVTTQNPTISPSRLNMTFKVPSPGGDFKKVIVKMGGTQLSESNNTPTTTTTSQPQPPTSPQPVQLLLPLSNPLVSPIITQVDQKIDQVAQKIDPPPQPPLPLSPTPIHSVQITSSSNIVQQSLSIASPTFVRGIFTDSIYILSIPIAVLYMITAEGGESLAHQMKLSRIIIGRGKKKNGISTDIWLKDRAVSHHHAVIEYDLTKNRFAVASFARNNNTFINGTRILQDQMATFTKETQFLSPPEAVFYKESKPLATGDILKISTTSFRFEILPNNITSVLNLFKSKGFPKLI